MKGGKEQPSFIAETFQMKIISASLQVNEQMIVNGLDKQKVLATAFFEASKNMLPPPINRPVYRVLKER